MYMDDEKGYDAKVVLSPADADGRPIFAITHAVRSTVATHFREYSEARERTSRACRAGAASRTAARTSDRPRLLAPAATSWQALPVRVVEGDRSGAAYVVGVNSMATPFMQSAGQ